MNGSQQACPPGLVDQDGGKKKDLPPNRIEARPLAYKISVLKSDAGLTVAEKILDEIASHIKKCLLSEEWSIDRQKFVNVLKLCKAESPEDIEGVFIREAKDKPIGFSLIYSQMNVGEKKVFVVDIGTYGVDNAIPDRLKKLVRDAGLSILAMVYRGECFTIKNFVGSEGALAYARAYGEPKREKKVRTDWKKKNRRICEGVVFIPDNSSPIREGKNLNTRTEAQLEEVYRPSATRRRLRKPDVEAGTPETSMLEETGDGNGTNAYC